jgi:signal transduction histidine kinase
VLAQRGVIQSIRGQILLIPVLVVALTIANLGFIGHLMFVSSHDVGLLMLVLLFGLMTAVVLSFLLSDALGVLLTRRFNRMAADLEAATARQRVLEQARRELVVAVSHDLRTPTSSIRAMVESINDGVVTDPDTVRRYLHTLETEVGRLSLLIDDLFELTQIDAGAPLRHAERASLGDLVSDTIESMRPQALQQGLALDGAIADALAGTLVDARRIQRVLLNLVQNAIRYSPSGGVIFIEARREGQQVRVDVRDTGYGISTEDLPHVFDPFFQADKARSRRNGGSGLGLSIVKALVEASGGEVMVTSRLGEGSTFSFTVPGGGTEVALATESGSRPAAPPQARNQLSRYGNG